MLLDDLILNLCFKTLPTTLDLDYIQQCLADIEPLCYPSQLNHYKTSPVDLFIMYEQHDPHGCGSPHVHTVRLTAKDVPVRDAKLYSIQNTLFEDVNPSEVLQGHTAHLRCSYVSGGTESPEPIIALYKVAYCFMNQGLLGLWDEEIAAFHRLPILEMLFGPYKQLNSCRNLPAIGMWHNLLEFHRPGGGIWFYTKGQERFGLPEFAYLGSAANKPLASSLFRELFTELFQNSGSLSVGDIVDIRPGLWIAVGGLVEHQDILESYFGTLVLQLHSENFPNPEQNDPSFRLWMPPPS